MRIGITFLVVMLLFQNNTMIFDFKKSKAIHQWRTTNDDVMGGISTSVIELNNKGEGVFSGMVSTENNGGFAMIRLTVTVDIKDNIKSIKLRLKGDGKKYQFRLKSSKYQRYWYVQSFDTSKNWETISLPLKDFFPSFRGYRLNKPNFFENNITEVAILIANKKDESFKLTLDYIKLD